jgi:hypothetical protein
MSDRPRGILTVLLPSIDSLEHDFAVPNRILVPDSVAFLILMSVFKGEDVRLQSLLPARGSVGCARPGAAARGDG